MEWEMLVGHELGSRDPEDCNSHIIDGQFALDSDF